MTWIDMRCLDMICQMGPSSGRKGSVRLLLVVGVVNRRVIAL